MLYYDILYFTAFSQLSQCHWRFPHAVRMLHVAAAFCTTNQDLPCLMLALLCLICYVKAGSCLCGVKSHVQVQRFPARRPLLGNFAWSGKVCAHGWRARDDAACVRCKRHGLTSRPAKRVWLWNWTSGAWGGGFPFRLAGSAPCLAGRLRGANASPRAEYCYYKYY